MNLFTLYIIPIFFVLTLGNIRYIMITKKGKRTINDIMWICTVSLIPVANIGYSLLIIVGYMIDLFCFIENKFSRFRNIKF